MVLNQVERGDLTGKQAILAFYGYCWVVQVTGKLRFT